MATSLSMTGSVTIGSVTIPLEVIDINATPLQYSYQDSNYDPANAAFTDGEEPEFILDIVEFSDWVAETLNYTLPDTLNDIIALLPKVGVLYFECDTDGNFALAVILGSDDSGWVSTWAPIPGLDSFVLNDLLLDIWYTPDDDGDEDPEE